MALQSDVQIPTAPVDGSPAVSDAVALLAPRWALPDQLAAVALTDMADDLGVDVDSLADLVTRGSTGTA